MEGQLQNQQKPDTNEARPRNPAIRTMKSDVQELFKTTKPSLLHLIGAEANKSSRSGAIAPKRKLGRFAVFAALIGILIAGGGVVYFFFPFGEEAVPVVQRLVPPAPFFASETSRSIGVDINARPLFLRLMSDSYQEAERQGTMKRLIIKLTDGPAERFANAADFFTLFQVNAPKNLLGRLSPPLMTFLYSGKDGQRLGIATKTNDPDRTLADMFFWESSMIADLRPLYFGERVEDTSFPFEDRTYRNIDWRYQKLSSTKDFGVAYAVFPARKLLLISFSKDSMETAINRLFDVRESF